MISKAKRTISLNTKICVSCGKEFQPNSGAQRTCSGECKERAKLDGLTVKRGPRNRGGLDPALAESAAAQEQVTDVGAGPPSVKAHKSRTEGRRFSEIDPGTTTVTKASSASPAGNGTLPELELDLSPIELYIRACVVQEVQAALAKLSIDGITKQQYSPEDIKRIATQAIEERLRGLLGK